VPGLQAAVRWANAGILEEPVIPADPERYPSALTIPRVSEIYVNPRYRVVELGPASKRRARVRSPHYVPARRPGTRLPGQSRPFLDSCHPAAGETTATLGHEEGHEKSRPTHLTQRGIRYGRPVRSAGTW
jgi:hypothetical protein